MDPTYLKQRCESIPPNDLTHDIQQFKKQIIDIGILYAQFKNPNLKLALDKLKGEMRAFAEVEPPSTLSVGVLDASMIFALCALLLLQLSWATAFFGVSFFLLHLAKIGHDDYNKEQHILVQQSIKDLTNLCESFYFAIEQEHPVPTFSNAPKNDTTGELLPSYTPEQ